MLLTTRTQPTVTLDALEYLHAAQAGFLRHSSNVLKRRADAHGFDGDGWGIHIEGALGEAAVAKWLGVYWSVGRVRADDVGRYQVRTRLKAHYDLIVHPSDPDDRVFILVTGPGPTYALRGWLWGVDAKARRWWRDPVGGRPAFFVPQRELQPMEALPQ